MRQALRKRVLFTSEEKRKEAAVQRNLLIFHSKAAGTTWVKDLCHRQRRKTRFA
jgi:hypothetical protein